MHPAPRLRRTGALALPVLLAPLVTGCGLLDGSSRLQEALEYLPGDATSVEFVDLAVVAERTGTDEMKTGASHEELDRWDDATKQEFLGSGLSPDIRAMQEAAFSELDLEWEASARIAEELVRVWRLSDDADFDEIAADLEAAGYDRSGAADAPEFVADASDAGPTGMIGDRYPAFLQSLALVPDEHLVISGDVATGLDVAQDDADSLADSGAFEDLLGSIEEQDGLELAGLALGDSVCGGAQAERDDSLRRPDEHAVLVTHLEAQAVLAFAGDREASDDLDARNESLKKYSSLHILGGEFQLVREGAVLRGSVEGHRPTRMLLDSWRNRSSAYACGPE